MGKHRRLVVEDIPAHPTERGEQLPCLVIRSTPDGYTVGRALVDENGVQWLSPTHVRDWTETRPVDLVLKAEKWVTEGGGVELRPKRVAKGSPVYTTVGQHVVFGEALDSAAHRARLELRKMFDAVARGRRVYWRHLCGDALVKDLPTWVGVPRGEACPHCGHAEKKASAA